MQLNTSLVIGKNELSEIKTVIINSKKTPPLAKIELLKSVGDYVRVSVFPKKKDIEVADAILKRYQNTWQLIILGTGLDEDDLIRDGVPKSLFD